MLPGKTNRIQTYSSMRSAVQSVRWQRCVLQKQRTDAHWCGSHNLSHLTCNGNVAAPGENLRRLLAIPPPAQHVIACRNTRHLNVVDDGDVGQCVAAALAILGGARRTLIMGLVLGLPARMCEEDIAGLISAAGCYRPKCGL